MGKDNNSFTPKDLREQIRANYGTVWHSLRGEPPPDDEYDFIQDAVIRTIASLHDLEAQGRPYLRGEIVNFFKAIGGQTPDSDEAQTLRDWAQEVVEAFPEVTRELSTEHLSMIITDGQSGIQRTIWTFEMPLYAADDVLWAEAQPYINYHDPQNLGSDEST